MGSRGVMRVFSLCLYVLSLYGMAGAEPLRYVFSPTPPDEQAVVSRRALALDPKARLEFASDKTVVMLDATEQTVQRALTQRGRIALVDEQGVAFAPRWASAEIERQDGMESLRARLVPEQHEEFFRWTAERVGTVVRLEVDEKELIAPKLMEPIKEGELVLTGPDLSAELPFLRLLFLSGPLADPLQVVEQSGWRQPFSGKVTALGNGHLELETLDGQTLRFDIVADTEAVPTEMAVRVGCQVEILASGRNLLRVEVIPFSEWIKSHPEANPE